MRSTLLIGFFCASAVYAQPTNQTGIAHVAFRVADLEVARAFYNKLGFEQFFEMKQGDRTTEAFLKINDHQFIELYPRTDPSQPLGLMHVCYESNDLEALHAEYVKRGLTVSDVRKAGAGNLLMTMKDPEGQTIEYTQYMPGSRHFEDRGKHLGADRVAQVMVGATSLARDRGRHPELLRGKAGLHRNRPRNPGALAHARRFRTGSGYRGRRPGGEIGHPIWSREHQTCCGSPGYSGFCSQDYPGN